jgi:peptidoglycan glycosyltransferase
MRKITNRAMSLLLIAALVIFGMGVYMMEYIENGSNWALYFSRINSGSSGTLLDRNGTIMASFSPEQESFASDPLARMANYHVTGDYWGRTGAGILTRYWSGTHDFSLFTGMTKSENTVLSLNIDTNLNEKIYSELMSLGGDTKGLMMVCNYKTGEMLGLVSVPCIDPADDETEPQDGAYINRCLSASFTPGSIFKLITAAAAIENIENIDEMTFYCEKEYDIAGVTITCSGTHYTQTFEQALSNSCNVAFAQIAVMLGQDTMLSYVNQYGFLDRQSLSGITTVAGSYPTEFVGDPELAWSGIGQSTDMVCPYTMLRFLCAIANDGELVEPSLIQSSESPETTRLLPSSTAQRLTQMMNYNVVDHYKGETNFPGLKLCAKTGTAELGDGTSHAWFVGFLADDEHPYAFVTLVERGGYGLSTSGPIVNNVLQWAVNNIDVE